MANVSRKKLANQVRELVERKGDINQPGRLLAHIVNELKLTGNSTIREPLIEAILLLEEQGIVEVDRRGEKTFDAIRRTKRKRARSTVTPTPSKKESTIPTTTAERPKTAAPAARPVPVAPKTTRQPAAQTANEPKVIFTSESTPSEAPADTAPPIQEMSPMEIIVELTAKYGELEGTLAQEKEDHAETKRQKQIISDAKRGVEEKLAEKDRVIAGKDREITGLNGELSTERATNENLRGQLSSLTDTLTTGADTLASLQEELAAARAEIDAARAENDALKQRDDLSILTSRLSEILRPTA